MKVDIQTRFRKVQGIQRYRFYLFSSCIRIIADVPTIYSVIEKEKYFAPIANHHHLIRYVKKVDIQSRIGKIQRIKRYRFYLFPYCIRIIAFVPTIYSVVEKEKDGFTNMEPVG